MEKTRCRRRIPVTIILLCAIGALCLFFAMLAEPFLWGYSRPLSPSETALRDQVVAEAVSWLGCQESDGTHTPIIDLYNSHTPLARGYAVKYTDDWCSTFVSAVAIAQGLTQIIPTECGCERHIEAFQALDAWVEEDSYLPLPGDYIFYHWRCPSSGDCTHWSDHVGIVVGTWGRWIKVIEGNRRDDVSYRILPVNSPSIRGYGTPAYGNVS